MGPWLSFCPTSTCQMIWRRGTAPAASLERAADIPAQRHMLAARWHRPEQLNVS